MSKKYLIFLILFFLSSQQILALETAWSRGIWYGAKCAELLDGKWAPVGKCDTCDALKVFQNIINMLVELAFILVLVVLVIGGLSYLTSSGSPERIKKSYNIIVNAIFGLLIVLFAWTFINILVHLLSGKIDFPWHNVQCG